MDESSEDLLFWGARFLSTASLLEKLLGPLPQPRRGQLLEIMALRGPALAIALEENDDGPALLAALELGRRMGWSRPQRGTAVRGPSDAIAVAARVWACRGERTPVVLALDDERALVRARAFARPGQALHVALAAGAFGVFIVEPGDDLHADEIGRWRSACALVDLRLLGVVASGARGWRASATPQSAL